MSLNIETNGMTGNAILTKISTVTLTDAQIKALPSNLSGIEIIPTPGANRIVNILGGTFDINSTAGAYTNVDAAAEFRLITDNNNGDPIAVSIDGAGLINNSASERTIGTVAPLTAIDNASYFINKNVTLEGTNGGSGNFTGGNAANTLKIKVYYVEIDLS